MSDAAHSMPNQSGLQWPGKEKALQVAKETFLGSFAPAFIDYGQHLCIAGENSEALKLLANTFEGKVSMIYIDPPYNSGNRSFSYADPFRKNGERDVNRAHAEWLSMIYSRLLLAYPLLTEDGVLFVSIDDQEAARLRLVLDELFGERNFIGQLIWVNRTTPNDTGNNFATDHEYILAYAKDKRRCCFKGVEKDLSLYQNRDDDPSGPWTNDNATAASGSEAYRFIITNPHTGEQYLPPPGRYWAFPPARVPEWTASGKLMFPKKLGKRFLLKKYASELQSQLKPMSSVITGFPTSAATKELKALFEGACPFRFPKPVALISYLIEQATNADDIILDFFAGSGTTAHAVLELNHRSQSTRRFVCVQLDEPNNSKDPALRAKYPLVCDVTKARIEKALALYQTKQERHCDFLTIDQKGLPATED